MRNPIPRRRFLGTALATGAVAGMNGLQLPSFPRLTAEDTQLSPKFVQFGTDIEPLVRLLETTPRERLLEEVGHRVHQGTTYREVLAALLLAGIRNIQPRPVGFKFHAVLVVNSAHLASQNSPDSDRWLPIFWALDQFKSSQARDEKEGDWTMQPVDEKAVPAGENARGSFTEAMDNWNEPAADAAAAGISRFLGAQDAFELFCRYGARDFRDIGHKAIYVANSWRTLQTIGWQHAEPVLRSLAYALLERGGDNPAQSDLGPDRPGRRNLQRLREIRTGWQGGAHNADATREMLSTLRSGDSNDASAAVVEWLNRGASPQSIWDAMFQCAAEMLMRRPGIVSLHSCTTTNALHYSWQHVSDDETRRFLMLQNAAFLPLFRAEAKADDGVRIDTFEAVRSASGDAPSIDEIFASIGTEKEKLEASRKALAYLQSNINPTPLIQAAQRYIYLKGTDSHDYKFSSAALEDYRHLSPGVRDRVLAASMYWWKGSGAPDNALIARTRAAV